MSGSARVRAIARQARRSTRKLRSVPRLTRRQPRNNGGGSDNPMATEAMAALRQDLAKQNLKQLAPRAKTLTRPQLEPIANLKASKLKYEALEVADQPPVPVLANELDRVLFNTGVQLLKDPRTNVYNFDERLEQIMSIRDFDFSCIPAYVPAGKDSSLAKLAAQNQKKFIGSTSSLTPLLMQLHHAISHQRPPQLVGLSKYFPGTLTTFSGAQRSPVTSHLRYDKSTETYSVNSASVSTDELILTLLGQVMEVMLVTDSSVFENFTKERSKLLSEDQRQNSTSTYNYTMAGKFLMRSQLDCYDPRLPGTGMFDLKTRAVCAVRHDIDYAQIQDGSDYQIHKRDGEYGSFSREYYELIRSALFKYSLQARIGRMDGIFVAYHNVRTLFGFEYFPLGEIDKVFHTAHLAIAAVNSRRSARGSKRALPKEDLEAQIAEAGPRIAEAEFKLSIQALETIYEALLEKFDPEYRTESFDIVMTCTRPGELYIFAKPMLDKHLAKKSNEAPNQDHATYVHGKDPHTLHKHHKANENFVPPDMKCLRITFRSTINGELVRVGEHPALKSDEDEWELSIMAAEIKDCGGLYRSLLNKVVSQSITSKPITERSDDESDIREAAMAKLPQASALQELYRGLDNSGKMYKEWDDKRPKLRWKPIAPSNIKKMSP